MLDTRLTEKKKHHQHADISETVKLEHVIKKILFTILNLVFKTFI